MKLLTAGRRHNDSRGIFLTSFGRHGAVDCWLFYVVVATKEITVRGRGRERETVWNHSRSLNKQNNKCKLDNKNNKSL